MNKNIKNLIEYPKEGILSKEILRRENLDVSLFCMCKGEEINEHTSTKKGIVYVIDGKGIFNLESNRVKMLPGVLIFMEKNARHSLKAEKNTAFLLILVK